MPKGVLGSPWALCKVSRSGFVYVGVCSWEAARVFGAELSPAGRAGPVVIERGLLDGACMLRLVSVVLS